MRTTARKPRDKAVKPPSRGRGRPVGDREAQRTKLLDAAIAVIGQDGFAEASLRKVAERAGCSTGAVTYYFANREEMMAAVIESQFDVFDAMLMRSDEGRADGKIDVRGGLKRWLDSLDANTEGGGWVANFQLLSLARHEPALAAVYQRRYAQYRDVFASMLAKAQRQGSIRKDIAPDLLADQISAMGDGWMMLFPVEPERFRPSRVKALLDATMALIAPQPS
ncbi:MAG: TetR/AcrR family transcriptional regulator [Alphaproteobacteria bacterium]|nr:TetR/AcrR family transcriptional regulator [Alphaproteobacteria bacterium]MBV9418329.1 TetR/AcrR family transcriptional regulator [Alphaproteobacteria bacterium]MBV9540206.1 TetR/AcrR family transcriptional regulator [Alphaproteobacteria bacterium]MBV9903393.1 TetR/AcrR family transcriptional regulator [Alphaproteobacteria bacterium]